MFRNQATDANAEQAQAAIQRNPAQTVATGGEQGFRVADRVLQGQVTSQALEVVVAQFDPDGSTAPAMT